MTTLPNSFNKYLDLVEKWFDIHAHPTKISACFNCEVLILFDRRTVETENREKAMTDQQVNAVEKAKEFEEMVKLYK